MLTDQQRDELLIRIDERVEKLRADMQEAKSADGFARCQVHATRVESIQSSLTWGKRLVVGGILTLIVKGVWPYISNYFTKGV